MVEKNLQAISSLQIIKKILNRHTRSAKNGGTSHFSRITLDKLIKAFSTHYSFNQACDQINILAFF